MKNDSAFSLQTRVPRIEIDRIDNSGHLSVRLIPAFALLPGDDTPAHRRVQQVLQRKVVKTQTKFTYQSGNTPIRQRIQSGRFLSMSADR